MISVFYQFDVSIMSVPAPLVSMGTYNLYLFSERRVNTLVIDIEQSFSTKRYTYFLLRHDF